jgi:hypothetical protein
MKRDFDTAATTWDLNDARTRMSLAIADAMIGVLGLCGSETLLDYGTGTGADNTGVEHFGFDRPELLQIFSSAGFEDIRIETAYEFVRPTPDDEKVFSIFLLSARKA